MHTLVVCRCHRSLTCRNVYQTAPNMSSRSYSAGSVARGQSSPRPLYAVLYLNRADVIPGVYGLAFSGTCLLLASALSIPSLHGLLISYKVLDNSAWLYKEVVTYSTTVG